jgi:hypothetical protein
VHSILRQFDLFDSDHDLPFQDYPDLRDKYLCTDQEEFLSGSYQRIYDGLHSKEPRCLEAKLVE